MRPLLELLDQNQVKQVLKEARQILSSVGIKIQSDEARGSLISLGATVLQGTDIVLIPEKIVDIALETTPSNFTLYDRLGNPVVHYGGNDVAFDPGSSCIHILDPDTLEHRPAITSDLVNLIKVTEELSQYAAQSTAVVCSDVPEAIGDLYRLFLVLRFSTKPVITGSFTLDNLEVMIDMLALFAGGRKPLALKPQAIFDVCPTPPLIWSAFGCGNLIALAKSGVPVELVSMPLAGAASPVTLLGSITQHAAESLAGIIIHQAANPGAPIVWGGAPAIFDMRKGGTPFGAMETSMLNVACSQIGKSLNLPTHGYLCASDSKVVDSQAGMESSMSALVGALAGINMISGAGMLDFLACQSLEKLVLDAEAISNAFRFIRGIPDMGLNPLDAFYRDFDFTGNFLKQPITRKLFAEEQYMPSEVIDRNTLRGWQAEGRSDAFHRAHKAVQSLLSLYEQPALDSQLYNELDRIVTEQAIQAGMPALPIHFKE